MFDRKVLYRSLAAVLLVSASANLYAVSTTYNYVVTGDVLSGDEQPSSPNVFNLTAGETITAYGTFTVDSSYATTGGTVSFGSGSGNTMTINLNGTLLDASGDDDFDFGLPELTFGSNWTLVDFDYFKTDAPVFNSEFLGFDDFDGLYGEWRTAVEVSPVPEADTYAMLLAGLGLVGFAARRKLG